MKNMNIVVVGAGMYVCGVRTDGYGTIMPAILEWSRKNNVGSINIAGTDPKNIHEAKKKVGGLCRSMGLRVPINYFPAGSRRDTGCYKEAIRRVPKPAVCIVAVPDTLHKDVAAAAIRNGLHTLVVKPLVPTSGQARELIALQKRNKVYCAVEFHKRLDRANMILKDIITRGDIGDPLYFLAEFSQRKSIPLRNFSKWVEGTDIFQYLGVHYVDIIYFATGAQPKRVMATGQKGYLLSRGIDTYDSIQSITEWEMPSGKRFTSNIMTNWIDPESTTAMSDQKIKVIGTKGRFESDQKRRGVTVITDENGVEEPNPYFCRAYGQDDNVTYSGYGIESICQFLDDASGIEEGSVSIEMLEKSRPTFKQSVIPTKVLECVKESLKKNGKWIEL